MLAQGDESGYKRQHVVMVFGQRRRTTAAKRQSGGAVDGKLSKQLFAYEMLAARRNQQDSILWQAPALALTAQAFLLTIALAGNASVVMTSQVTPSIHDLPYPWRACCYLILAGGLRLSRACNERSIRVEREAGLDGRTWRSRKGNGGENTGMALRATRLLRGRVLFPHRGLRLSSLLAPVPGWRLPDWLSRAGRWSAGRVDAAGPGDRSTAAAAKARRGPASWGSSHGPRGFDLGFLVLLAGEKRQVGNCEMYSPADDVITGLATQLRFYGRGMLRGDYSVVPAVQGLITSLAGAARA